MKLIKSKDDYKAGDLIFIKEFPGVLWTCDKTSTHNMLWPVVGSSARDLIDEIALDVESDMEAYNLGSFIKYMQQIAKVAEQSIDK